MKKKIITGFIFITLAILLITIGVWFAISGMNSGNVNFIAGPLVGVLFINDLQIYQKKRYLSCIDKIKKLTLFILNNRNVII